MLLDYLKKLLLKILTADPPSSVSWEYLFAYFIVVMFRSQILWHLLWLDALLYLFLSLRGFCFFNSVAIAAKQLQQKLSASKILIVDWVRALNSNFSSRDANSSVEVQSAAEFSWVEFQSWSNSLTCDFLMILKTLINMLRCVWLGLELNSAGVGQIWGSLG